MKIEGGKQIPSPLIVSRIAQLLPKDRQDELFLSYCSTIFPERDALFSAQNRKSFTPTQDEPAVRSMPLPKKVETSRLSKGSLLSTPQFNSITQTKIHYLTFIVIALARAAIPLDELKRIFPEETIDRALFDLTEARVAHVNAQGEYRSVVNDLRFPPLAENPELKEAFDRMISWERDIPGRFSFETEFDKLQLRRCTKRSRELIQQHCKLLFDVVRISEDSNSDVNQEVVFLDLFLSFGNLPG
ncbi:MAG: hypothetical protein EOP09_15545 [Proteobacteria bacterium]|nr:MAG: hypothetical protein EOP09_15545 [Pseudomonadota bacterium]